MVPIAMGYLGALGMGISLGAIGGGGSILVYGFGLSGVQATYASLFVVGACAALGVIPFARRKKVAVLTGLTFFVPSVLGLLASRRLLLPALPQSVSFGRFLLTKDLYILLAFGGVMISAAISMLKTSPKLLAEEPARPHFLRTGTTGIAVGLVTGFVGAGGGFLIVPALVKGLSLPMGLAVGTSLMIIALNSLTGFAGDWLAGTKVEWGLILPFTGVAMAGILMGSSLTQFIPESRLKPAFGWFVLVLGTGLILKQFSEMS